MQLFIHKSISIENS